jgi:hypothetical protein
MRIMEIKEIRCPYCGARVRVTPGTKIRTCDYCNSDIEIEEDKNEILQKNGKIYFNKHNIIITNQKIQTTENIYFVKNTISVSKKKIPHKSGGAGCLIVLGILTIPAIIGIFFLIYGIYLSNKEPDYTYCVVLITNHGEIDILNSNDEFLINEIINAISQAIIDRDYIK